MPSSKQTSSLNDIPEESSWVKRFGLNQAKTWFQLLLFVLLCGGAYAFSRWGRSSEKISSSLLVGVLLGGAAINAAWAFKQAARKAIHWLAFLAFVLPWLATVAYPSFRLILQKPLGSASITQEQKPSSMEIQKGSGPFEVWVQGTLGETEGSRESSYNYELQIQGDQGSQDIEGTLKNEIHQTMTRRGNTQWQENHTMEKHVLNSQVRGKKLSITSVRSLEGLSGGLQIQAYPRNFPFWAYFLAWSMIVLLGLLLEIFIVAPSQGKSILPSVLFSLLFTYRFQDIATPTYLSGPIIDALLLALILGGGIGLLVGWILKKRAS